jgi:excisionase family DNA binding protein
MVKNAMKKPVTKAAPPDGEAYGTSLIAELRRRKSALRPKELAVLLAISERQVTALVKAGRLPGLKIGGCVRIDPATAASWLEQRRTA